MYNYSLIPIFLDYRSIIKPTLASSIIPISIKKDVRNSDLNTISYPTKTITYASKKTTKKPDLSVYLEPSGETYFATSTIKPTETLKIDDVQANRQSHTSISPNNITEKSYFDISYKHSSTIQEIIGTSLKNKGVSDNSQVMVSNSPKIVQISKVQKPDIKTEKVNNS